MICCKLKAVRDANRRVVVTVVVVVNDVGVSDASYVAVVVKMKKATR